MKRLLMIIMFVLILASCTPDEDTAASMQVWYDQCEAITTCSDKIDELRESELSESDIITAIQESLAEHEAELQALADELARQEEERLALEQRVLDLEYRTAQLEYIGSYDSSLYIYLRSHYDALTVADILTVKKVNDITYYIHLNLDVIEANGGDISAMRSVILNYVNTDLADIIEKDKVTIRFQYDGNTAVYSLEELID